MVVAHTGDRDPLEVTVTLKTFTKRYSAKADRLNDNEG
jgi:hypothetical protein